MVAKPLSVATSTAKFVSPVVLFQVRAGVREILEEEEVGNTRAKAAGGSPVVKLKAKEELVVPKLLVARTRQKYWVLALRAEGTT